MVKTKYEEIVNVSEIGSRSNSIVLNELLAKAGQEAIRPAHEDSKRVLVIGIDPQQDFMENGNLGVPGSIQDMENFCRFIYKNLEAITKIDVSIDTHSPFQIFHPCWWVDKNNINPNPYTVITLKDIDDGVWTPVLYPKQSREYVLNLEMNAKKTLCIWPYHCIQGTSGNALENQFANMVYFHSVAKKSVPKKIVKGTDPLSEMYGIIKPEYDTKNYINMDLLNEIEKFDVVIIGGEAKSHCVMESVAQMLDYFSGRPEVTSRFYILEDCMSSIPGFEKATEDAFNRFKSQYKINIVKSTDLML